MSAERERRVLGILQSALEREPAERGEFLSEACAGDEELRSDLESLLESHEKSASFLDRPAAEVLQKASSRVSKDGARQILAVPLHKELDPGTLRAIYRQA